MGGGCLNGGENVSDSRETVSAVDEAELAVADRGNGGIHDLSNYLTGVGGGPWLPAHSKSLVPHSSAQGNR